MAALEETFCLLFWLPVPKICKNSNMTCVHDFCVYLTRGGYSFKEINEAVERSLGVKAISRSAIYKILAMMRMPLSRGLVASGLSGPRT